MLRTKNVNPIDSHRKEQVIAELRNYESLNTINGSLDFAITEQEVLDASKNLKNNKSIADDMIKNEMIKSALPMLKKQIVDIFNIILKLGKFLCSWTQGIIVPVHKQGSKFDANNYRGITLSSCFGKLFCHVLNERILKYIDNISFLRPEQVGFRKHFRTIDHIYVLKTIVDKYAFNCTKGGKIYACFIVLRKAFDTVWHDGLLLKLQKVGINGIMSSLIKSNHGSVPRVKCKQLLSDHINITQGVHQGNILSPLLFNIFMNDIGDSLLLDNTGVVPCGGPKKFPRTSSIVQIIFSFWSFEISGGVLGGRRMTIGLGSFSNQRLNIWPRLDFAGLCIDCPFERCKLQSWSLAPCCQIYRVTEEA